MRHNKTRRNCLTFHLRPGTVLANKTFPNAPAGCACRVCGGFLSACMGWGGSVFVPRGPQPPRAQLLNRAVRLTLPSVPSPRSADTEVLPAFFSVRRTPLGCCSNTQSCPTLCDPVDYSPPGSSVHGILQAGILEWVAISSSRGSSQPRGQTWVSSFSCTGRRFPQHEHLLGSPRSTKLPPITFLLRFPAAETASLGFARLRADSLYTEQIYPASSEERAEKTVTWEQRERIAAQTKPVVPNL